MSKLAYTTNEIQETTHPEADRQLSADSLIDRASFRVRRSHERGYANHGWLESYHSFSFADYYDPEQMGFRSLRVINDDKIAPKGGFPMHPHSNMEIFSYVVSGAISHRDTLGNSKTLRPGEIQLMSTGSGIEHAEFNPSEDEELHLLQIWITPNEHNVTPTYTEWKPNSTQESETKTLIISPDGRDDSATIHQDVLIYRVKLQDGENAQHHLAEGKGLWLQVVKGKLDVNGETLSAGDALSTEQSGGIKLTTNSEAELLLFDLS